MLVLVLLAVLVAGVTPTLPSLDAAAHRGSARDDSSQEPVPPGEGPSPRVEVFIGFRDRPGRAEEDFVRREGGRVDHRYRLVRAVAAHIPQEAFDRIRADGRVTHVEEVGQVFAVDHTPELDNTWGVKRIGAGDVHHVPNTGAGVRVGVLDSGIDTDHVDVAYDPTCSYNFVSDTVVPEDGHGHGTHVAGTVAAYRNLVGVVGGAPAATLCVYKVLNDSGSGSFSDIVAALDRAVADGVQITNNSYGSSSDPGRTVQAAFDNAYAAGVLHAAAAGNSGNGRGTGSNCIYPARYGSVVATAATTSSDSRASFSSTCAELDLAAPGSSINSTKKGGGYGLMSGTSMASPHVAGAAALVLSANPGLSNGQVRQRLQETAQDLGVAGRDSWYGYGLVRPDLATGGGATTSPTTGSITGTVTDSSTGSPVQGATVSVDTGQSAITAADGTYTIPGVPIGERVVTATTLGYEAQTQAAAVAGDQATTVNFAVDPTPSPTAPTATVSSIAYSTEGGKAADRHLKVTITVVDGNGNAVSNASVSMDLYRNGSKVFAGTGTTGSNGKVALTLSNASAGCYQTVVTSVAASGLTWDGKTPTNQFCK